MATQEEQNKETYRRFVAQLNTGNFEGLERFYHPDYVEHSAPPGQPANVETIKMVFGMFRHGLPDVEFVIEDLVAEGDKLATLVRGHGTNTGDFFGTPASGHKASWYAYGINRFENGLMIEHWGLPDLNRIMQQIGAAPGGPGGPGHAAESAEAAPH